LSCLHDGGKSQQESETERRTDSGDARSYVESGYRVDRNSRWPKKSQAPQSDSPESKAEQSSAEGQHECLDHECAGKLEPARAERTADAKFLSACIRAKEHQVGQVNSSDQKEAEHGRLEEKENRLQGGNVIRVKIADYGVVSHFMHQFG
jgi:hypothetical protein